MPKNNKKRKRPHAAPASPGQPSIQNDNNKQIDKIMIEISTPMFVS